MSAYTPEGLQQRAEQNVHQAALTALQEFLDQAREIILAGGNFTADSSPEELPPDLDAWPDSEVWSELARQHITPHIGVAFDQAFDAAARSDALQAHRFRQAFMDQVNDRLTLGLWEDGVFTRIRSDLAEGMDAGESVPQLRQRISTELDVDHHSYLADRIARTESHAATEGGTWSSLRAWEEESGEVLHQQWIAADDERTRPTHAAASGQRVPLDDSFTVGGVSLQYPGDPNGPAEETINCRCSTLSGTQEELDDLPPSAADTQGSAMPNTTSTETSEHATTVTVNTYDPGANPAEREELSEHWQGVLAPLDVRGDFRVLVSPPDGQVLTADHMWLSWQERSASGHDGKVAVGVIDSVWAQDGHLWGRGRFDLADETGTAPSVARKVADGFAGTVSVDTNDLIDATIEYRYYDRDDQEIDVDNVDFDDFIDGLISGSIRELLHISNWRLGGATLVQDPAFHSGREGKRPAFIESADPPDAETDGRVESGSAPAVSGSSGGGPPTHQNHKHEEEGARVASLTAAAGIDTDTTTWAQRVAENAPMEPPSDWFTNPNLTGPTKVRVTSVGRVYGHVACWDTGHIGYTGQDVRPPKTRTGYGHFHRHRIRCADGSTRFAGSIVMGTGHADLYMSSSTAMDHYDHTGYNVADVAVGEDAHGIWFSGSLKPGVSALQVLTLDRYSLSGDWRSGELVGVCVVNVPGFPIPEGQSQLALAASGAPMVSARTQSRFSDGDQVTLVASGVVPMFTTTSTSGSEGMAGAALAFEKWMRRIDQSMQSLADSIDSAAYRAVRRATREGPEMRTLAHEVNAAAVEDARRAINKED